LLAYCGDDDSLKETRRFARSDAFPGGLRVRALQALWFLEKPGAIRPLVEQLLTGDADAGPAEFRGKILDSLEELDDPEVGTIVLKAFPRLSASLRARAIELLTERPAWTKALLAAVADKKISTSALNVTQLRKLQDSDDREIAGRIKAIWGTIREGRDP